MKGCDCGVDERLLLGYLSADQQLMYAMTLIIQAGMDSFEKTSGLSVLDLTSPEHTRSVEVDTRFMRSVIDLLRAYYGYTSIHELADDLNVSVNTIFYALKREDKKWSAIVTRTVLKWFVRCLDELKNELYT